MLLELASLQEVSSEIRSFCSLKSRFLLLHSENQPCVDRITIPLNATYCTVCTFVYLNSALDHRHLSLSLKVSITVKSASRCTQTFSWSDSANKLLQFRTPAFRKSKREVLGSFSKESKYCTHGETYRTLLK